MTTAQQFKIFVVTSPDKRDFSTNKLATAKEAAVQRATTKYPNVAEATIRQAIDDDLQYGDDDWVVEITIRYSRSADES